MNIDPNLPYNTLPFLPPGIDLETPEIWRACNAANISLARLREAGKLIPNQDILISAIPLLEATASSEIENIFTTSDDLYRALSLPNKAIDPATKEVLNYRSALYTGFRELKNGENLGEALLTDVCTTLLGSSVERRSFGVYIGNRFKRVYTPPDDPNILETRLNQLEKYIEGGNEPDPLIRLALIHYQFEAIHPFIDGNGRTGRILNILYLVSQGLLDIPVLYLSRYIIQTKSEYYDHLRRVTFEGAWNAWILYILKAIKETADWTYTRIYSIYDLMNTTQEFCKKNLPGNIYSHELINLIFLQPYCKPKHLVNAGIGNRQTAMKYLKELENIGVVSSRKISREVVYVNTELFELLKYSTD